MLAAMAFNGEITIAATISLVKFAFVVASIVAFIIAAVNVELRFIPPRIIAFTTMLLPYIVPLSTPLFVTLSVPQFVLLSAP